MDSQLQLQYNELQLQFGILQLQHEKTKKWQFNLVDLYKVCRGFFVFASQLARIKPIVRVAILAFIEMMDIEVEKRKTKII